MDSENLQKLVRAAASAFAHTMHDIEKFVLEEIADPERPPDPKNRLRTYTLERSRFHLVSALDRALGTQGTAQTYTLGAVFQNTLQEDLERLDGK